LFRWSLLTPQEKAGFWYCKVQVCLCCRGSAHQAPALEPKEFLPHMQPTFPKMLAHEDN
jgi:hypothetical protein